MLYQLLEVNFILMAWTFNSFSWPKKKEVHLLFASVEFQVSESIFHVREEHARCGVRVPWYTGIWVGYAATPSQPLLSGCFPRKYTMFRDLGFWVVPPKGGSVSAVWVPGQNVALADDFFDSGRNGDSSESYRLRSFSQAAICKHAMDKMGEAGKIGGKRVLWPFWLMLHLLACRRGAAEWRLRGSCTRVPFSFCLTLALLAISFLLATFVLLCRTVHVGWAKNALSLFSLLHIPVHIAAEPTSYTNGNEL